MAEFANTKCRIKNVSDTIQTLCHYAKNQKNMSPEEGHSIMEAEVDVEHARGNLHSTSKRVGESKAPIRANAIYY